MAKKIKGITIEIGGDSTKFQKAINSADKAIRNTQKELKALDKALKIDPGNTDLLKRKQELLNATFEETSKKLKTLKDAYDKAMDPKERADAVDKLNKKIEEQAQRIEDAKKAMNGLEKGTDEYKAQQAEIAKANRAMAEYKDQLEHINDGSTVSALKAEIVETETALKSAKKEASDFGSVFAQQMKAAGSKVEDFGKKVRGVGDDLTKYVTVPLAGIATASIASFNEIDDAEDIVIAKTGATGDALEAFKKNVENIATKIPVSFSDAGTAVGEVATRFGLAGDELEQVSMQFLKFAKINGTDVNTTIDNTQKALDAFGLDAKSASGFLDVLNKTGQDTGADLSNLVSTLTSNATAFQDLGFSMADATKFLGEMETRGLDASTVLQGLAKAQTNAFKNGGDLYSTIENALNNADKAIEVFGAKAGPKLYDAFQNGTLSIEDFVASQKDLTGAGDSVTSTFEAMTDPLDEIQTIMNELKALSADFVETSGPMLKDILKSLSDTVKGLSENWEKLSDDEKKNILKAVAVVAALGPIISAIGSIITMIGAFLTFAPAIETAIGTITGLLSGPVGWIALIAAGIGGLIAIFPKLSKAADEAGEAFQEWNAEMLTSVGDFVYGAFKKMKELGSDIVDFFKNIKIELPHIPTPHFKATGSLNPADWFKNGLPKIDIDWYKKAQNTPYLFNSPSIIGVGDVPEVVIGADTFNKLAGGQTIINQTINATVRNDNDITMLAKTVSYQIQQDINRRTAGWK